MSLMPKKSILKSKGYCPPPEGRPSKTRLDLGESHEGFDEHLPEGLSGQHFNCYPDYENLKNSMSALFGVSSEFIHFTNGSDEALNLIAQTFIEPGEDSAVISSPCFLVIERSLEFAGANLIKVPVTGDLQFDLVGLSRALETNPKLFFIATPDNPTGATVDPAQIALWAEDYPNTLFVIDEAYFEFSGKSSLESATHKENLIITRTFSKAWGLAGLRLGVIIGSPRLLTHLRKVSLPFAVNSMAALAASKLSAKREVIAETAREVVQTRNDTASALTGMGYHCTVGEANFFLLGAGIDALPLAEHLRSVSVLVKPLQSEDETDTHPLWGRLKVSVGSKQDMNNFLETVSDFGRHRCAAFDLDGTLIDTTGSYHVAIEKLIETHTRIPATAGEIEDLESAGGFNDSWDKALALIRKRGADIDRDELVRQGQEIYFEIARHAERLLIDESLLGILSGRLRLFVFTGRTRAEYEKTWAERLDHYFEAVYCRDDIAGFRPKPAPDYLNHIRSHHSIHSGVYIGNTPDDMWCASAANFLPVAITSIHSEAVLKTAGATIVLPHVNDISRIFRSPPLPSTIQSG